jgi:hypothetical protein
MTEKDDIMRNLRGDFVNKEVIKQKIVEKKI